MSLRKLILAGAACLIATLPCAAAEPLTKASLRLKWLANDQFAGYYLALDRGYYKDVGIDLTINPGGPNLLTENLVATGADTFGVSGGTESVMAAREKGLPIVAVGVGHQITPFVFVTRKDGPVKTIKDFAGKKVTSWFTGAHLVLQAMLAANGVPPATVNITPQQVSFTPFINGDVDVVTATRYTDVLLVKKRLGADNLKIFDPEDFGISIPRDTVIVSEATAKADPKLVENFMRASIKGWQEARKNPDVAVDAVMKVAPTLDRQQESETLVEILKLMSAGPAAQHGLLWVDRGILQKTHDFLLQYGAIKKPIDLAAAFDNHFLEAIPEKDRMP